MVRIFVSAPAMKECGQDIQPHILHSFANIPFDGIPIILLKGQSDVVCLLVFS